MGYCSERVKSWQSLVEPVMLEWEGVRIRSLYGCPAFQVEGYLFAFLVDEGIVLAHLSQTDRERLAAMYTVEEFKAGDRVIAHWLLVHIEQPQDWPRLLPFVRRSYEATRFFARPF